MTTAEQALRELLDGSANTAEFLAAVQRTIERLYAESDSECPEGFRALDQAIEAFEAAEAQG